MTGVEELRARAASLRSENVIDIPASTSVLSRAGRAILQANAQRQKRLAKADRLEARAKIAEAESVPSPTVSGREAV